MLGNEWPSNVAHTLCVIWSKMEFRGIMISALYKIEVVYKFWYSTTPKVSKYPPFPPPLPSNTLLLLTPATQNPQIAVGAHQ